MRPRHSLYLSPKRSMHPRNVLQKRKPRLKRRDEQWNKQRKDDLLEQKFPCTQSADPILRLVLRSTCATSILSSHHPLQLRHMSTPIIELLALPTGALALLSI